MDGLRLFGKCEEAARNFSKHDSVDVLVICGGDTAYLYIDGRAREIPWVVGSRPSRPQEGPVSYVELNPLQVQFGHWNRADETFTASRKMTVEEFLNLAVMTRRSASAG
jgi:hypothetical protein